MAMIDVGSWLSGAFIGAAIGWWAACHITRKRIARIFREYGVEVE